MPDINKTDLVAGLREDHRFLTLDWQTGVAREMGGRSKQAASLIEAQAAEISRLRDALKPFAEAADVKLCGEWEDDAKIGRTDVGFHVTFGHLRRARTALEEANHG